MITTQISIVAFHAARVILLLLGILSFLTLAFFTERMLFYRKRLLSDDRLLDELEAAGTSEAIQQLLERYESSEADVVLNAMAGRPESGKGFSLKVGAGFRTEKARWEKYTVFLGSVGSNAPFIGLLGTVLGILKSFADLGTLSGTGPKVVMAGISEALVLTAVGLAVAIPAVVFFNICKTRIKAGIRRVESITDLILSKELFGAGGGR